MSSTEGNNNSFDKIIRQLYQSYYTQYPDMPEIKVSAVFTDSLSRSHFEIRPDMEEELTKQGILGDDTSNGRMVLPRRVGDTIFILLNSNKVIEYSKDGSMTWIGTFAHELTHAIDYYQMSIMENMDIYDALLRTEHYLMFQLWSEFHARKTGYSFLRNFLSKDIGNEDEQVNHILNYEWPHQLERHFRLYHATNDGNKQMDDTMQLLGRFSVWCDLFPEVFNETMLNDMFRDNIWMKHLLDFLRQCPSLDKAYSRFDEMRRILKENWESI